MKYRDKAYSKGMRRHPTRWYWGTRGIVGAGRELRDLRTSLDDVLFGVERGAPLQNLKAASFKEISIAAGLVAQSLKHYGMPDGYEKAAKSWVYTTGKTVTITAVKPGELGNLIKVTWANGVADAVSVVGTNVTLTVTNDDATTPADMQAVIDADPKARTLISLSATDATPFPGTWASAAAPLAGGTGIGLGFELQGTWGATDSIAFFAKVANLKAAQYEIEWLDTGALSVTATRKRCTINYQSGVTTFAQVKAAVDANKIAVEHLETFLPGDGSGTVGAPLDTQVTTLSLDFGTAVFIGDMMCEVTEVTDTGISFDLPLAMIAGWVADTLAQVNARIGLMDLGTLTVIVLA